MTGPASADAACPLCGAGWAEGAHTLGCPACGGGAMGRSCPVCGGACGRRWRRALADSRDRREAHWIGSCGAGEPLRAALGSPGRAEGLLEWWLDEAALPDLLWACLVQLPDGSALVIDLDLRVHAFDRHRQAEAWLRQEEYERREDLVARRLVSAGVSPPRLAGARASTR